MRIISGKFRGRRLAGLPGRSTRPTADRVKEALFNILGNSCHQAMVLDLFAGTGALGLEALSRGARQSVFVDNSRTAITVIKKNILHCGASEWSRVLQWNVAKNLDCLANRATRFNLVFMDPPYGTGLAEKAMAHLEKLHLLREGSQIVVEHAKSDCLVLGPAFQLQSKRSYGRTVLSFITFSEKINNLASDNDQC